MPQAEFQNVASAGIIVLLVILLAMNAIAILLRNKFSKNINIAYWENVISTRKRFVSLQLFLYIEGVFNYG